MTKYRIEHCYIVSRNGEMLFGFRPGAKRVINLDGYAIVPLEEYEKHIANAAEAAALAKAPSSRRGVEMTDKIGRSPDGSGYSAEPEPSSTVSALAGFDPSREALNKIAFLRPAGDVQTISRKDAIALVERMERIAVDALDEGANKS